MPYEKNISADISLKIRPNLHLPNSSIGIVKDADKWNIRK